MPPTDRELNDGVTRRWGDRGTGKEMSIEHWSLSIVHRGLNDQAWHDGEGVLRESQGRGGCR